MEKKPGFVLILGGVAAGKSTLRREEYGHTHVALDAGEIFIRLSAGRYYDFPSHLEGEMDRIGSDLARKLVLERRDIVTEMIGGDADRLRGLIDGMTSAGYSIKVVFVHCDLETEIMRNLERGDDNISAYYTEAYHARWLIAASEAYI